MNIRIFLLLSLLNGVYCIDFLRAENLPEKNHTAICVVEPMKILPDLSEWNDCKDEIRQDFEKTALQIKSMEESLQKKTHDLNNMGSAVKESSKDAKREEILSLRNDIELKRQLAQEHVSRGQQETEMKVLASVANTSKKIAQEHDLDLVLANVAHASDRVDISQPFKDQMNKDYVSRTKKSDAKDNSVTLPTIHFTPKIRVIEPISIVNQLEERSTIENSIKKEVEAKVKQIKTLEESLQKELMDLQTANPSMSLEAKEKKREKVLSLRNDIELKKQTAQESFERLQQDAELKILNMIAQTAKDYAKLHTIDIVLANVIYASERVNVSAEFVDQMNAQYKKEPKKSKKEIKEDDFAVSIRVIDPLKIINGLDEWKDQVTDITKELEERMKAIKKLDETLHQKTQELQNMGSAVKASVKETKREELLTLHDEIERKKQTFQEYAERLQREAEMKMFEKLSQTAKIIAQKLGVDIIVANVVYAVEDMYVSGEFITYLNNEYRNKKAKDVVLPKQQESDKNPAALKK